MAEVEATKLYHFTKLFWSQVLEKILLLREDNKIEESNTKFQTEIWKYMKLGISLNLCWLVILIIIYWQIIGPYLHWRFQIQYNDFFWICCKWEDLRENLCWIVHSIESHLTRKSWVKWWMSRSVLQKTIGVLEVDAMTTLTVQIVTMQNMMNTHFNNLPLG